MKMNKILTVGMMFAISLTLAGCNSNTSSSPDGIPVDGGDASGLTYAKNPTDMINNAHMTGNYSIEIIMEDYLSYNSVTNAQWEADPDSCDSYLASGGFYNDVDYLYYMYFMEDSIYIEQDIYTDALYRYLVEVYVNDNGTCWQYYTFDGYSWGYYSYPGYSWQNLIANLETAYQHGMGDMFVFEESTTYDDVPCDVYTIASSYIARGYDAEWFCILGGDLIYSNCYSYAYYYIEPYQFYFFESTQSFMSTFVENTYATYDTTITDESLIYACRTYDTITLYDVGNTDQSELCFYYHNALQANM